MSEVVDSTDNLVPQATESAVRFTESMEEAKAKIAEADAVTAESLGVDQASFDKYHKGGEFNWAGYGKEQAFKASQKAEPEPVAEPEAEEKAEEKAEETTETGEAQEVVERAGLDWDDLGTKIGNDGDVSAEDYAALAKIGIPDNVVKQYIEMVRGESQNTIDSVIEAAGGQANFDAVFDALQSKPEAMRVKIDTLLMDPATREYGVDMMFREAGIVRGEAQAEAAPARRSDPAIANNRTTSASADSAGYSSFEEQITAQRDPRYKTDVAYRNSVMAKIGASSFQMNSRTHTGGL